MPSRTSPCRSSSTASRRGPRVLLLWKRWKSSTWQTASTATLALLGALLEIAGAYIALAATYRDDLDYLSDVPVVYLVLAVVGVPLVASAAGWLLAGREPPAIARTAIE
jgi:uncharacterized membrane protein